MFRDKIFLTTISISLFIHSIIFACLIYFAADSQQISLPKKELDIQYTFIKKVQENSPTKEKKVLTNTMDTNFKRIILAAATTNKQSPSRINQTDDTSTKTSNVKIELESYSSENSKNAFLLNSNDLVIHDKNIRMYYESIKDSIQKKLENLFAASTVKGKTYIEFTISKDGTLLNISFVDIENNKQNKIIKQQIAHAMKLCNPFRPFPKTITKNFLKFNLIILVNA